MTDLDIKPGETWLRRDGGKARIYATDGSGLYPIHGALEIAGGWTHDAWTREGSFGREGGHQLDLIRRNDWRAELAPIWAVLRPEYRWLAMDRGGSWWAYQKEPEIKIGKRTFAYQVDCGLLDIVRMPTPDCDWTKTCVERPEEPK